MSRYERWEGNIEKFIFPIELLKATRNEKLKYLILQLYYLMILTILKIIFFTKDKNRKIKYV
jgi:hypothetical protein